MVLTFGAIDVSVSFPLLQQIPETHQLLKWKGLIMANVFRGFNHGWFGSVETQHIMEECGLKRLHGYGKEWERQSEYKSNSSLRDVSNDLTLSQAHSLRFSPLIIGVTND